MPSICLMECLKQQSVNSFFFCVCDSVDWCVIFNLRLFIRELPYLIINLHVFKIWKWIVQPWQFRNGFWQMRQLLRWGVKEKKKILYNIYVLSYPGHHSNMFINNIPTRGDISGRKMLKIGNPKYHFFIFLYFSSRSRC